MIWMPIWNVPNRNSHIVIRCGEKYEKDRILRDPYVSTPTTFTTKPVNRFGERFSENSLMMETLMTTMPIIIGMIILYSAFSMGNFRTIQDTGTSSNQPRDEHRISECRNWSSYPLLSTDSSESLLINRL